MDRRVGKFYIDMQLVHNNPFTVRELLASMDFLPLRVECRYDIQAFEYVGASYLFDELDLGCMPYDYSITVKTDGEVEVSRAYGIYR